MFAAVVAWRSAAWRCPSPAGLHETLALLTSQLRPDADHKEDMVFLRDVFSERSLGYLMKVTRRRFIPSSCRRF